MPDVSSFGRTAIRTRLAALSVFTTLAFATAPALADYGLDDAYGAGEEQFRETLVRSIAQKPLEVDSIIEEAIAVAPDQAEMIRETTIEYFPGFEEKVTSILVVEEVPAVPAGEEAIEAAPPTLVGLTQGWSGEVALSGEASTGDTQTEGLGFSAALNQNWGKWQNQLAGVFDFSRDDGEVTQRRWEINGETRRDFTERMYVFGFLGYTDDTFAGFDYRFTESAGLGYRLIKQPDMGLTVQAGPGFRQTQPTTGDFDNTWIIRASSDYFWQIVEGTRLTNVLSVSYGPDNTITEDTIAVTTNVVGGIAARLSFNARYETDPEANSDHLDTISKISLVYALN